jgi:colicin import membrane protein
MKHLIILVFFGALSIVSFAQENIQGKKSTNCKTLCQSKEACTNLIIENIAMNWSRPPINETQNMQVTVKILLLPDGTIEATSIEAGSGHERLDSSVLQAVKRASSFCEIQGLSHEVYEKNFKELIVVFNNQDSRN